MPDAIPSSGSRVSRERSPSASCSYAATNAFVALPHDYTPIPANPTTGLAKIVGAGRNRTFVAGRGSGRPTGVGRPPLPQPWTVIDAASSTTSTTPRFKAARTTFRTRGEIWTSTAHLLRQPGYLREARGFASPPRDGFASSVGRRRGRRVDRRQQPRRPSPKSARGLLGLSRDPYLRRRCRDRLTPVRRRPPARPRPAIRGPRRSGRRHGAGPSPG